MPAARLRKVVQLALAQDVHKYEKMRHPEIDWPEISAPLLWALDTKGDFSTSTTVEQASALFNGSERPVVLATDEALTLPQYAQLKVEAASFVRNGRTIIFCCHFSGWTNERDFKPLFAAFSLPWETPGDCNTDFDVNSAMTQINTYNLVPRYNQTAVLLSNVQRGDAVYLPAVASSSQAAALLPPPIADLSQTPAAFGTSGQGKVGYVGDVHLRTATDNVILAMCGLQ